MNKILMTILIIGLLISTAACSNVQTVKTDNSQAGNAKTDDVQAATVKQDNVQASTVSAIADIKKDEFLGKTVTVQGTVVNNVKTSSLSGYRLKDATDSIPISSQTLPKVNTTVTVKGIVQKSSYFGLYIVAVQ